MSNAFDKLSVLDSFIEEVNSYLPEIETNLERLSQSSGDMDALEETYRRTHTIGGSASMMDFPGLAHVAHGMEDILGDALDGLITLDERALGLLLRSLGRLRQLLEGIRTGVDEESVIAEDDADFSRYRTLVEAASSSVPAMPQAQEGTSITYENSLPAAWPQSSQSIFEMPFGTSPTSSVSPTSPMSPVNSVPPMSPLPPSPSAAPSFDEVLSLFRTPAVVPGEEMAWPEDPFVARLDNVGVPQPNAFAPPEPPVIDEDTAYQSAIKVPPPGQSPAESAQNAAGIQSAFEALMNSTRRPLPSPEPEPFILEPSSETPPAFAFDNSLAVPAANDSSYSSLKSYQDMPEESYYQQVPTVATPSAMVDPRAERPEVVLPQVYKEAQHNAQVLEEQASSLKDLVGQLREAMTVIEVQRGEFRGFLDGSKDALDRMEDWAGRAMGLNLRNSPEQVRRYLPLSVMWVATSKLKKVMDLLGKITGGVELTDSELAAALHQLQNSIQSCGEAFQQASSSAPMLRQDTGWGPWEMQVARDAVRERVTFERQGDLAVLRAEMEATLREEIKREYEAQYRSSVSQLETEQRIRAEVQQEFEDRQRLQQRAAGEESLDRQELEARVRRELEIQVRQELLTQIAQNGTELASAADQAQPTATGTSVQMTPPPSAPPPMPSFIPPAAPMSQEIKSQASFGDFGEEAAEIFRMEAEEHLQTISLHVAALEKDPHNRDLVQGVRRATHTLKGAAAMMGFRQIADLSHISEDLLDTIMEGVVEISPPVLSIVLDTAETLDQLITGKSDSGSDEARVRALQIRYSELLGERSSVPAQHVEEEYLDLEAEGEVQQPLPQMTGILTDEGSEANESALPGSGRSDLTVRVRLQRLDELVNLFGELLVNRSVLEERIQRLIRLVSDVGVSSNRLRDVGQKLESRFEAATLPSGRSLQVMPGEGNQRLLPGGSKAGRLGNNNNNATPAHLAEFDELELDRYTEFHQLARGLSEGISDMTTLSTEMDTLIRECEGVFARENRLNTLFQDRLMKTRLVPLSQLTPRLYRAGRAVGLKQKKEFEFIREGEGTEVDRTVFEEIGAPLLHLVRNAVNHALETPDERVQKGKPAVGCIKFSAAYEGNQIVIAVSDDGKGLDRDHIRNTAISRGLIRPDQQLSEGDYVSLIFHPGFSTAEVLSEESGRGVGLDVVRDTVSRLRGTIVVESAPDQGTTFTMTFPTSLAIQRAMMVRMSGQQFAIPTVHVESIGRFDNFKHVTASGRPAVLVRNDPYPLQMLAQYLALPNTGVIEEKAQLILVNAGGHRVALVVDEIKGQSDIVMKNLGPHLRHVHGLAGATVLGNGLVVLVLELNSLLSGRPKGPVTIKNTTSTTSMPAVPMRREAGSSMTTPATSAQNPAQMKQAVEVAPTWQNTNIRSVTSHPAPERSNHVLVVDDSPSVRRVVSNMLKQHGWDVKMARDGVEALEMISYETPAAVLLDIEMPRMDGYELISTVRAQEQYRTLPLIVLTSRAAAKHQQRAASLGASGYVVKPYQDEELLNTINNLVYGTTAAR
jgi:chemotaxis protein histidine kinase CheA/ActR/RegA family two-component response regulator